MAERNCNRLEVPAGTEVVWADPHFERVWFPTGAENPTVRRVAGEFRVTFAKPGTYHRTNDVYSMIVVVKPRPRQTAPLAGTVADEISYEQTQP